MQKIISISFIAFVILAYSNFGHCQGVWSEDSTKEFTGRFAPASCVLGGKIYVMGGDESPYFDGTTNIVEVFDPVSHLWDTAPSMPTVRCKFCCNVVGGKIYAFGGDPDDGGGSLDTVEVFDSATMKWSAGLSMPLARSDFASVAIDGNIYVIGGSNIDSLLPLNSVDIFNINSETWSPGTPMPTPRYGHSAFNINGKIYVFGGIDKYGPSVDTVEIFDPVTNMWGYGPSMPTGLSFYAACEIDNKIYITGGVAGFDDQKTLEIFDPSTNTWSIGPDMPTGRTGPTASAVGNKMYVLAGMVGSCCALNTNEVFTPVNSVVNSTVYLYPSKIETSPNPFSQSAQITFTSESAGYADISVVNLLGEQVARIFSGELDVGQHNFTFSNSANLPDGMYECLVRMNGQVEKVGMALLH